MANTKGFCIAVTPDGSKVVVGLKDGSLRVLSKDLQALSDNKSNSNPSTIKLAKGAILEIKFTSDQKLLVCSSQDHIIYVLQFPELKQKFKPFRRH